MLHVTNMHVQYPLVAAVQHGLCLWMLDILKGITEISHDMFAFVIFSQNLLQPFLWPGTSLFLIRERTV